MLIVDPISGKMWKLQPDVTANLSQKLALNTEQPTVKIMTVGQVPEHLRKYLVRIN